MSAIPQPNDELVREVSRRRTFAIISHPDAGKTTLTEKLLLFSGAIQIAGSVKARKASRHATAATLSSGGNNVTLLPPINGRKIVMSSMEGPIRRSPSPAARRRL